MSCERYRFSEREKVAAMGPLHAVATDKVEIPISCPSRRPTQDKRKFVQISHSINFVGSFGTIIQLFSGCQLNTLRRALRLLLRELRLNDLQLQDGSAGTAQLMVVECQHGSKCQRVSLQRLQFFTCQNLTSSNRLSPCTRWLGSQTCIEMSERVSRG